MKIFIKLHISSIFLYRININNIVGYKEHYGISDGEKNHKSKIDLITGKTITVTESPKEIDRLIDELQLTETGVNSFQPFEMLKI